MRAGLREESQLLRNMNYPKQDDIPVYQICIHVYVCGCVRVCVWGGERRVYMDVGVG